MDRALQWAVLADAKRDLIAEGTIQLIWGDFYRLSDAELARRIVQAVGLDDGDEREAVLLDRVAGILRGVG